jgi:hypothetical protein
MTTQYIMTEWKEGIDGDVYYINTISYSMKECIRNYLLKHVLVDDFNPEEFEWALLEWMDDAGLNVSLYIGN